MDNRQTKPTGPVPSRASVIYDVAWMVLAAGLALWVFLGAETDREFVGAGLGMMLALMMFVQAVGKTVVRSQARMRARADALESALAEQGYTVQQGIDWVDRQPGSPTYKPGPY